MNELVEEMLRGAYDLHVHAAPDGSQLRRMDALEVARCAYEAEMGGFVLRSQDYNTVPLTYALNQMYPGLSVFGSITLNSAVGGINPDAVQVAAGLGAQVVSMPSQDYNRVRVTDDNGNLTAGVREALEIIAANDMTLVSGRISSSEAIALFAAAKDAGIERLIATPHTFAVATPDEQHRIIALGAYAEFAFLACMPSRATMTPQQLVKTIRAIGARHCIITTALGQWQNPPPAEGMRMAIAALLDCGMPPAEVSVLVKGNTAALLGK
ncbi:MAG: hypothetical protein F4X57_11505 [Chloroflexi bacterium]|nr:hypothetical protein [Chloroflexota bacterium]